MTFNNTIIHGDCVQALAQLDPASVDFVLIAF
jgi:DNA modification methylase